MPGARPPPLVLRTLVSSHPATEPDPRAPTASQPFLSHPVLFSPRAASPGGVKHPDLSITVQLEICSFYLQVKARLLQVSATQAQAGSWQQSEFLFAPGRALVTPAQLPQAELHQQAGASQVPESTGSQPARSS